MKPWASWTKGIFYIAKSKTGVADLKGEAGAAVAGRGGTAGAVPGVAGVPSLGR